MQPILLQLNWFNLQHRHLGYFWEDVQKPLQGRASIVSRRDAHPHKVHLLAALHEGPDLGAEFFPHALQVMEDSQFLEGLVHLESGNQNPYK